MWLMYLIALIPTVIGACLWIFSKEVIWWEWLVGTALAFVISVLVHIGVVSGMMRDTETWSGHVISVSRTPFWYAKWQELETYTVTVGSGKDARTETKTRLVTKTRSYPPTWSINTNIGGFSIGESEYKRLNKLWGEEKSKPGYRPDFDYGDRSDYYLVNKNNHYEPVHDTRTWENRIKAAPSTFSYPKVDDSVPVYKYPSNTNLFRSNRLIGEAKKIDNYQFDCMCARLGPAKKVNVIIVGFGTDKSSQIAHDQEAKWIGGKKNDLVLCYGGSPKWTYVFGWTEETLVKRNLETILLTNEINTELLSKIEEEICAHYQLRDWSQFDYISPEIPTWAYLMLIGIMSATQVGFWLFAQFNPFNKEDCGLFRKTV